MLNVFDRTRPHGVILKEWEWGQAKVYTQNYTNFSQVHA